MHKHRHKKSITQGLWTIEIIIFIANQMFELWTNNNNNQTMHLLAFCIINSLTQIFTQHVS